MKGLLLFVSLTFASVEGLAQSYRNTHWGATRREVVSSESTKPTLVSEDMITFDSARIADYRVSITYMFESGKLCSANYSAQADESDSLRIRAVYAALLDESIIDLGEPKFEGDEYASKDSFISKNGRGGILFWHLNGRYGLNASFVKPKPVARKK